MMTHIKAIASVSADGKIADRSGSQVALTSPADNAHLRNEISSCNGIAVARKTFSEYQVRFIAFLERNPTHHIFALTRSETLTASDHERLHIWRGEISELRVLLDKFSVRSLAVLGGGALYSLVIDARLADELVLTKVPNLRLPEGTPFYARLPNEELWKEFDCGALGYRPFGPTQKLQGNDDHPEFELRRYRR
jgi:dihydrofolate reductase